MGANQHPLDDPAPMSAYRGRHNHNLLSALRFGGSEREKTAGSSTPENLFDLMISAAKSMGIKHTRAKSLIQHLYLKDVMDRLPTQPYSKIQELLPHNWSASK